MSTPPESTARYRTAVPLIVLSGAMAYSLKHGPQPLIPSMAATFSLTPAEGSLVVAAEMIGMSAVLLAIILWSDFLDRKRTTGLGLLASALLAVFIGEAGNFPLIVLCRFFQGVLLGTFPALMVSYIREEFPAAQTGPLIGLYISSTAGGGMLGRMGTTLLTDHAGWQAAFLALGAVGIAVALLYLWRLPSASPRPAHPRRGSLKTLLPLLENRRLLLLSAIGFVLMGTFATIYTYITFVLLNPPYALTKTALAPIFLMQIFGSLGSFFTGRALARQSHGRLMFLGLGLMMGGALITLASPIAAKFIGLAVFISGLFTAHTTATSWIGRLDDVHDTAPAVSLYMLCYYIGGSVLAVLGGFAYAEVGWPAVIALIAAATLVAFVAALRLCRYSSAAGTAS